MDAIDIAATDMVSAGPSSLLDLGAVVAAPMDEPSVDRWPGWLRATILIGGAAGLWAVIAWAGARALGIV